MKRKNPCSFRLDDETLELIWQLAAGEERTAGVIIGRAIRLYAENAHQQGSLNSRRLTSAVK
jgi:predicted transcriptional regulator